MTMPTPDVFESTLPRLRVAMCQVRTEPWEVTRNLDATLAELDAAHRQGAQFAITPENVLQGYPVHPGEGEKARLRRITEPLDGPNLAKIRAAAKSMEMDVVVGFAEKATDGRFHNSCAFIGRDGEIKDVYRKVHCRPFESAEHQGLYTPGTEFLVVPLECKGTIYRIGMMICFDREIPESVRCLRALGAEFIACPLATGTSDLEAPLTRADNEMLTRARAAENEVFIAVVNHARTYNGGSFLVGPSGELLKQMNEDAGTVVLEVPVGAVRELFHKDPLGWAGWGFRKPAVYEKYLND